MKVNFNILKQYQNNIYRNQYFKIGSGRDIKTTSPIGLSSNENDKVEINFKASCSTLNFEIKDVKNLHCPACGLIMLTESQIKQFVDDVANKKGDRLIAMLEKYEDESVFTGEPSKDGRKRGIYRPAKQKVVNIYKELAREFPKKDLVELTKIQSDRCIGSLISKQLVVVDELKEYITNNVEDENDRKLLLKKLYLAEQQIYGKDEEPFSRKRFIYMMKNSVESLEHKSGIVDIASKMPTSENDTDSFFVKYARKSKKNSAIAQRLVNQNIATAEHLMPRALGGPNKLSNYICDCADCNSKRGHIEFYDWAKTLPGFEKRLQTYLEDVQKAIDDDKLSEVYDSYVEIIADKLVELSHGEMSFELPEIGNVQKRKKNLFVRQKQIEKEKSRLVLMQQEKEDLEEKIMSTDETAFSNSTRPYIILLKQIITQKPQVSRLRQSYIKKINEKKKIEEQIEQLQEQINFQQDSQQAEELTSQQQRLQKRQASIESSLIGVRAKERQLATLMSKESEFRARLNNSEGLTEFFIAPKDELSVINDQIAELSKKIKNSDYQIGLDEYKRQLFELTAANVKILESLEMNESQEKDVIATALLLINGIDSTAKEEAQKRQEVVYYMNNAKIKELRNKISSLQKHMPPEIKQLNARLEELKKRRNGVLKQRSKDSSTYKPPLKLYKEMLETGRLAKAYERLDILDRAITFNAFTIEELKGYEVMTNAQYQRIYGTILKDEVYKY